jgi:hypothetical protein
VTCKYFKVCMLQMLLGSACCMAPMLEAVGCMQRGQNIFYETTKLATGVMCLYSFSI